MNMFIFNLDKYCQIALRGFYHFILQTLHLGVPVFLQTHQQSCHHPQFLRKWHPGPWIQLASICSQYYIFIFSIVFLEVGPCSQLLTVYLTWYPQSELIIFPTNLGLLHKSGASPLIKCASQKPGTYSWHHLSSNL